jgi:hypothetical protein
MNPGTTRHAGRQEWVDRPVLSLRTDDCQGGGRAAQGQRRGVRQGARQDAYGGIDAVFADSCGNLLNLHQD